MAPDLEEMIRQRAHEIWEQEGRPHGQHEEHWQKAVSDITQELDRIKATHKPVRAEDVEEAPTAPRKVRPRQTESAEKAITPRARRTSKTASADSATTAGEGQQDAPRKRGRRVTGEDRAEPAPAAAMVTRRRVAKGTEGAQSEAAPKTRRRKTNAAEANPDANATERPARRGRKPKSQSDAIH